MSQIPEDLLFSPINDRFCEGARNTSSWINGYLNSRLKHNLAPDQSKQVLDTWGQNSSLLASRFRGALLGLALGDALGTTLEFSARDSLPKVTKIVGGGPFSLKAGEWTDDTSMALCLAHSLIRCERFNPRDQLELYHKWWQLGAFSVNGRCFDIGNTVREALIKYEKTGIADAGNPSPSAAGNGSLMRLAPVVLFNFSDPQKCVNVSGSSSKTTHQAPEAIDACRYFGGLLFGAIAGVEKEALTTGVFEPYNGAWKGLPLEPAIELVAHTAYKKSRNDIKSSGYVVDTLEAAIWAFHNTDSFEDGAILAANLGGDADTVAAVYGQIAGAYYGEQLIDPNWIKQLSKFHIFYLYADKLLRYGLCDYPQALLLDKDFYENKIKRGVPPSLLAQ